MHQPDIEWNTEHVTATATCHCAALGRPGEGGSGGRGCGGAGTQAHPEDAPAAPRRREAERLATPTVPCKWFVFAPECGITGSDVIDTRIVGGYQAPPHIFPWMVAILYNGFMNCGGSLINDRYVLTAGHCLNWVSPKNISVMLGINDLLSLQRVLPRVDRIIVHDDFDRDFLHDINDVALIRLAESVPFNDQVAPVCLPQNVETDYADQLAIVAGWGRVGQDKPLSRFLLAAEVRVISNDFCRKSSIGDHIKDNMLCTYYEKKDACQGDSGGPLVVSSNDGHFEQIAPTVQQHVCSNTITYFVHKVCDLPKYNWGAAKNSKIPSDY
ncbi:trypsin-7-like [Schistocerca cancellata]|uniref:trypsin-7-like n=1 Tax=Schistocerca cancellata TaxID=274614 RepID=UPI002117460A|nr:trypsin-7-like [Schistocerca cancellata]